MTNSTLSRSSVRPAPVASLRTVPERFGHVYRANGGGPRRLQSWEHVRELLHLLGLHDSMAFVVVEHADGGGRWTQMLGSPDRMVVEVADEDGPMRVARSAGPVDRSDVVSAEGFVVQARCGELWSADPVARVVRGWLTGGWLPADLDATLVPPLDLG